MVMFIWRYTRELKKVPRAWIHCSIGYKIEKVRKHLVFSGGREHSRMDITGENSKHPTIIKYATRYSYPCLTDIIIEKTKNKWK